MPPLVSVIVPTYNRKNYVQEAIDSILAQSFTDYEIIVVDDGSTDGTGEALAKYGDKIRYYYQENRGESAARNKGARLAQGKYLAFLDSDDLWLPDKLSVQIQFLEERPDVGMTFSPALCIYDSQVLHQEPLPSTKDVQSLDFEDIITGWHTCPSGVVIRKAVFDSIGGFDESIRFAEDWDLWLRVALIANISGISRPLAKMRLHSGGQWYFPKAERLDQLLKDHLRLLERACRLWPDVSEQSMALRRKVIAREYADNAWLNYAFDRIATAQERLQMAIELDPDAWHDCETIIPAIVEVAVRMATRDPDARDVCVKFVDRVLTHLPASLRDLPLSRRKIAAQAEVELGYRLLALQNPKAARKHLIKGMFLDPRWMRNRGTVALIFQLLGAGSLLSLVCRSRSLTNGRG